MQAGEGQSVVFRSYDLVVSGDSRRGSHLGSSGVVGGVSGTRSRSRLRLAGSLLGSSGWLNCVDLTLGCVEWGRAVVGSIWGWSGNGWDSRGRLCRGWWGMGEALRQVSDRRARRFLGWGRQGQVWSSQLGWLDVIGMHCPLDAIFFIHHLVIVWHSDNPVWPFPSGCQL